MHLKLSPEFQIISKVGFPKTLNKEEAHVCQLYLFGVLSYSNKVNRWKIVTSRLVKQLPFFLFLLVGP